MTEDMQPSDSNDLKLITSIEPQPASQTAESNRADHETTAASKAAIAPVEDQLTAQIVKQVNFYFSDTNLPMDAFLLKEVLKNPDGWVPVRLIASFKRIKALSKDVSVIVAALRTSPELEINGHRVRRKAPLSIIDETEVLSRTVIAENLPDKATIDSLTAQFSSAGKVIMVRICQPNGGPRSVAQTVQGADLAVSRQLHALIEYSNADEVAAAVKQLTDNSNWRSGLRVRPLLRTAFQPKQRPQQHDKQARYQQPRSTASSAAGSSEDSAAKVAANSATTSSADKADSTAASQGDDQQSDASSQAVLNSHQSSSTAAGALRNLSLQANAAEQNDEGQAAEASQRVAGKQEQVADVSTAGHHAPMQSQSQTQSHGQVNSKGKKGRKTKKDYAAWAGATAETRALASAHLDGNPDLGSSTLAAGRPTIPKQNPVAHAPGAQPSMPDGSKGFAMGRGRALA